MKKKIYNTPEFQIIAISEHLHTLTEATSNPDVDGTSVLVS